MARALGLARAQLGRAAPNPAVGCVIIDASSGRVIAEAATGDGGRPHAEERALALAGARAAGARVYVTLEPCARRSSGAPSCSERLVAAGVGEVVIACLDPHENAAGAGVARLEAAGADVRVGCRGGEAEDLNAGFFSVVRLGRPLVAVDADGSSYDARFVAEPGADLADALKALAREGLTRVCVTPRTPLADALARAGLIDRWGEGGGVAALGNGDA